MIILGQINLMTLTLCTSSSDKTKLLILGVLQRVTTAHIYAMSEAHMPSIDDF